MPNMFGGDQFDESYAPSARCNVKPRNVNVHVENVKVVLNETSVVVEGEYHFYNDEGKQVETAQKAKLMKLNFTEDKENGTVCLTLTRDALSDIVSKLNAYPKVYSFDANSH